MTDQTPEAQKAEVAFRRKLFEQQVLDKKTFDDEHDAQGIQAIMSGRMRRVTERVSGLKSAGIIVSPFLEVGAERCQSSLALENNLGCSGAAVDISFDMLGSCEHYMGVFGLKKAPLRVCCDANCLPFLSGSLPFVFCHQVLHHFPDPSPVVAEVLRVLLPGGHFLLEDEPYRQVLHLPLYKGRKAYAPVKKDFLRLRERLDFFFSEKSCNEAEYGVMENDRISLGAWRRALSGFSECRVSLRTVHDIEESLVAPSSLMKYFLCWLFGGRLSGLSRKAGELPKAFRLPAEALACPACRENWRESTLAAAAESYSCAACGSRYPVVEGVLFLFSAGKLKNLYPEVFSKAHINKI